MLITSFPVYLIDRITSNWTFNNQIATRNTRNLGHFTYEWQSIDVDFGTVRHPAHTNSSLNSVYEITESKRTLLLFVCTFSIHLHMSLCIKHLNGIRCSNDFWCCKILVIYSIGCAHTYLPIVFWAVHMYSPPSSSLTFDMFTWLMTSSCTVTYWPTKNRELSGIYICTFTWQTTQRNDSWWSFVQCMAIVNKWFLTGKPSNVQVNWGGGFPVATHLSETVGPGCSVCSENQ